MKKVFISQPMAGMTDAEILERRKELIELVKHKYADEEIEVIDSFTKSEEIVGKGRIAMLGDSISLMADADIVIFAKNWRKSKGCMVEHEVCVQYRIMRIYEELISIPYAHQKQEVENHIYWSDL